MPTYEYRCPKGHHFELFQKMTDEPRGVCPECGQEGERLISGGGGFLFKGNGFYITDYRSESYKEGASKEKAGSEVGKASDKAGGKKKEPPSPAKKEETAKSNPPPKGGSSSDTP